MKNVTAFLGLLMAIFLISGCAVNPVTGKRQIVFTSEEKEIEMGKSYDPQIVAQMGRYENPALAQFLTQKGNEMAAISERPNLPWKFTLIDSPQVNAFAVPGGFVYFTRGIMAHFNNEAQFAGVLGHEIGHITARHTVVSQARQTLGQIGLIGGMVLSPTLASQGQTLMQGMQLLFLKYGRDAESQSDELGVKYSTQIGYDAREMAGFFGTLDRLTGGRDNRIPEFTSTHPDPANRQVRVQQLAQAAQSQLPAQKFEVDRNGYLRRIDGLIYGTDPKAGYVEAGSFYHPDLRFQFKIPGQWQLVNSPQQVQIVSPDQKSVIQMRLAQGTDTRAAAQQFIQETGINVASNSDRAINGLQATTILGDITQQAQQGQRAQSIRALVSFIAWGGNIYMMAGIALPRDFNRYQRDIEYTIGTFSELTDQSKINKQAERIRIVTNPRDQTIGQALQGAGMPQGRIQELAILNGMDPSQRIAAGTLFKALSGDVKAQ